MSNLHFLVLFLFINLSSSTAPASLKLVSLVFRHGDRSPIYTYANDPYQEDFWPQGFGQLTKQGIGRAYKLGLFLREKYQGFLNTTYKRQEVYVRSTDKDRTLMSAQAMLNGLYPPGEDQQWKEDLKWQPIPVHTVELKTDVLFGNKRCTKSAKILSKIYEDPKHVEYIHNNYKDVFEILSKNSGNGTFSNETGEADLQQWLSGANRIADAVYCEKHNNLTVPQWIDEIWEPLQKLQFLHRRWSLTKAGAMKLSGGVMLGQFVRDMDLKVAALLPARMKAFIYSGHDSTLWALTSALGLFHNQTMNYSTCIMVELHHVGNGNTTADYEVRMFRRDGLSEVVEPLVLKNCSESCRLDVFINLTRNSIPEDRERECEVFDLLDLDFSNPLTIMFFSVSGAAVLIVALVLCVACCCCRKGGNRRRPRMAPSRHGYGKLRAAEAGGAMPEEMPMMRSPHGGSDDE